VPLSEPPLPVVLDVLAPPAPAVPVLDVLPVEEEVAAPPAPVELVVLLVLVVVLVALDVVGLGLLLLPHAGATAATVPTSRASPRKANRSICGV
jgi:hypothetical protein